MATVGPGLLAFIAIGPLLVLGYNLELFGGWIHTDLGFAVAWGAFPVLVGYFVQAGRLDLTAACAALAAVGLSLAQRRLSTPARALRRRVARVDGNITMQDGSEHALDAAVLLEPLERALSTLSWAMVALALAMRRESRLLARALFDDVATKPVDRDVDDAIVSPPKHRRRDPRGEAHRSLHHFDGPRRVRARLGVVAVERELRRALEIAVHECRDEPLGDTVLDDDIEPHSIRKRRDDCSVQHSAMCEPGSFGGEPVEPAPPRRVTLDACQSRPQPRYRDREDERRVVIDDARRSGHGSHATQRVAVTASGRVRSQ